MATTPNFLFLAFLLIIFRLVDNLEDFTDLEMNARRSDKNGANHTSFIEQVAAHIEESLSTDRVAQDYACVEYEALKDTYWALKWADRFKEAGAKLGNDWMDYPNCIGSAMGVVSTCKTSNVQLTSGLLLLRAHPKSHPNDSYTGGLVSSHASYTFDRLHLRASLPLGTRLHSFILATEDLPYKAIVKMVPHDLTNQLQARLVAGRSLSEYLNADTEFLEVLSHAQSVVSHGLAFNETTQLRGLHQADRGELSHFHSYGVVWAEDGLEFSLDGAISRIAHRRLRRTKQQIAFFIGVDAPPKRSDPEESEPLDWICPALIVDSVRVFDRVSEELAKNLERCTFPKPTDDSVIEQICPKLKSLPDWGKRPKRVAGNPNKMGLIVLLVALGCVAPVVICFLVKFAFGGTSRDQKMQVTCRPNETIVQTDV